MKRATDPFDRSLRARSLAFLFLVGALIGCLTIVLPHEEVVQETPLWCLAGVAITAAGVLYVKADRVSTPLIHAALAAGTLILSLANYWVEGTVLYPLIYSWTALYAFYFFGLGAALAHLAWVGVSYAAVLFAIDMPSPEVRWVLAVGTPAVAGLLVYRLMGELETQLYRNAEQTHEARENEARTRQILETAHDGFTAIDSEGRIVAWNAAAEDMFGHRARDAIGRTLGELAIPPEESVAHDERRSELFSDPGPVSGRRWELPMLRRDGTRVPIEVTVSRIDVGEPVLAAFMRDLSEERRRDTERQELLREQDARRDAEQVAEMVSGMQLLVDAALAHTTLEGMMAELLPRVRAVLDAEVVSVLLAEQEEKTLYVRASTGTVAEDTRVAFGHGFAGTVASRRRPMIVQEPVMEELTDPALREAEVTSLIGVPLVIEGEITGVIQVGARHPRRFSDGDLAMLRLAGDRVALALEHAQLFEREHRIAETLQRSLLPERLPRLPGLEVTARYLPAAAEAEVGGDWYDVIPMPGGGAGLVMGDVAGKGLAAASMVGRLRSALRAYALEGHPPATVVERLNRLVWTELEDSEMATLLYLVFEPVEDRIRWVNAGHLPPLIVVGDGPTHFLQGASGVPLGVMPFPNFEEDTLELEQGSTVLLYTDGLIERPGRVIDEGLGALAAAVRDGPGDPDELCDNLLGQLVPEEGANDDVALLALRNTPVGDRFEVMLPAEPESLAAMRALLRRWLRHAEGSEQEIAEITTACGEACTNAIEHAGAGGSGSFQVIGDRSNGGVDIVIRDYGSWRPARADDQGRGLSLMDALMDAVEVSPSPEGTTVRLRRRLERAVAA